MTGKTETVTRLGELTAYDLGKTIEFTEGGATYRGVLWALKHTTEPRLRTFVAITSGKWRHAETYPANKPVTILPRAAGGPVSGPGLDGPVAVIFDGDLIVPRSLLGGQS